MIEGLHTMQPLPEKNKIRRQKRKNEKGKIMQTKCRGTVCREYP